MRRITLLAIVLVIIIGGWSAAWVYASGFIRGQVGALADADGQTEPRLTCGTLDVGGYPFWFDVTCGDLTATQGDISVNMPELKATVLVYDPFHAVFRATGPVAYSDAFTGSKRQLDWSLLEASAHLVDWRIGRISIVGDQLKLSDTIGGDTLLGQARHAEFHLLDIPKQHDAAKHLAALALYAKADDLSVPDAGISDGKSTLEADISALPDDVRTYGDGDLVQRWRAAGGKVKLVGFKGQDGEQDFDVTGNVGRDAEARPEGQVSIRSKGLVERFGSLLVPQQWQGAILGSPGPDGRYSQTINMTNGVAFAGLVPLGTLPPLL
jgi:hypothetical protein